MKPDIGDGRSQVERAIDLVERGWSYRRIAKLLGIGKSTVGDYVAGEYGGDAVHEKREHLRGLELARIDRVIRRLDKALRGSDDTAVKAAAVLVKASESRRKLLGLDAPTKVQEVPADEVAKMTPAEKLEAHRKAIAELEAEQAAGKDGMH